jgi:hypothetical protein
MHAQAHAPGRHVWPATRLGRWAVALGLGFFVFNFLWRFLPGGGSLSLLSGLAGGVAGLVAVFRRGERGLAVYATFFPLLAVVGFVLAELLIGHD